VESGQRLALLVPRLATYYGPGPRVAHACFLLARVLPDRELALAIARRSRESLASRPARARALAALDAWLASPGPVPAPYEVALPAACR
jgi:hypothetical protein